ncbi:hypothetical protein [Kitasatospora sp. NBC_00070]
MPAIVNLGGGCGSAKFRALKAELVFSAEIARRGVSALFRPASGG